MTDTEPTSSNVSEAHLVQLSRCPEPSALRRWATKTLGVELGDVIDQRALWLEEIETIPSDIAETLPSPSEWVWAVYPWLRSAVLVPDELTTYAVLTSRNYPMISRVEQEKLRASHVVLVGLSTGRAVAQQLVRLGVGSLHLVDGDHLAPSNTNRLVGTRLTDMGVSKVVSTARELLEFNPYMHVTVQAEFLDGPSLTRHLAERETAAVVEMIDGFGAKAEIRRAARAFGVPVVMPTAIDWHPMVDVDLPDAPMFGGRLTDEDVVAVESPTTGFAEKTEIAKRFMALERWAPRSFLSGELAKRGLVKFWSQTAPAAAVGAALVARAVLDIVRSTPSWSERVTLAMRNGVGTDDPIDRSEALFMQLMDQDPTIEFP